VTTHERLVAARNKVDRDGWIRLGAVPYVERGPISSCAQNAITNNEEPDIKAWRPAADAFADAAGIGHWSGIPVWNDRPERTKAEVLAAFDRAIAATAPPPPDPQWSELVEAGELVA
jgi:hypothetical protein